MDSSETSRIGLILTFAFFGLISVLALILSSVAVGRSSVNNTGNTGTLKTVNDDDDYVWTIAAGHSGHAVEYIDDSTGQLQGFSIDLIKAVCQEANKKCEIIWDLYPNCFDSETGTPHHGGVGLMDGWYDACSAWVQTRERLNTFKFSKPFNQQSEGMVTLYTADSNSGIDWHDLTDRTVAFLDGWATSENCLLIYDEITGFDKSNARYYQSAEAFIRGIKQNEVDCGFAALAALYQLQLNPLVTNLDYRCSVAGTSVMMRKDSQLDVWWNEAFDRIRRNGKYIEVCRDLNDVHGHVQAQESVPKCVDF